jgi:hypothetical protein
MPGLENEVIVRFGGHFAARRGPAYSLPGATDYGLFKIGLPLAEVIVHIQAWHLVRLCLAFERGYISRRGFCATHKLVSSWKLEIVDDIDQKKRNLAFVNNAVVIHSARTASN